MPSIENSGIPQANASAKFLREFGDSPSELYSYLGVERHERKLGNGLTVVHFEKPGTKSSFYFASVGGGRFDPQELQGRAHYNEHMVLAGTSQYPRKDLLVRPIENEGGNIGAATSDEFFGIHISTNAPDDTRLAIDLASQCIARSLYDPDTLESERGAVLQEMNTKASNPQKQLYDEYKKAVYPGTSLERPVIGTKESVMGLTRENIMQHGQEMLVGRRMAVVVAGNMPFEQLMEEMENGLGALPSGDGIEADSLLSKLKRDDGIVIRQYPGSDRVFFDLGFRTEHHSHPDRGALEILGEVLGGGRASLLNQRLRYAKGTGWIYGAHAGEVQYSDAGTFLVQGSTTKDHLQNVFDGITEAFSDIKENGLSSEQIEFAKNKLIKSYMGAFETSSNWVGSQLYPQLDILHPHPDVDLEALKYPIHDYLKQVAKATPEDIQRAAVKYFVEDDWRLGICGDVTRDDFRINF